MKSLIVAAVALAGLAGCVALPGPYYAAEPYYYPAPTVSFGVYSAPVYRGHGHRHYRHWR